MKSVVCKEAFMMGILWRMAESDAELPQKCPPDERSIWLIYYVVPMSVQILGHLVPLSSHPRNQNRKDLFSLSLLTMMTLAHKKEGRRRGTYYVVFELN